MTKEAILAGGCFWGETVRGTVARLIVDFYERSEIKSPMSGQVL
jgi:peptide methionine sulfoxide reductase MsrA